MISAWEVTAVQKIIYRLYRVVPKKPGNLIKIKGEIKG